MTRFLRFVKSAHFFAIAIACVFGVLLTTNALATCTSSQYTGPNGDCQSCSGSQLTGSGYSNYVSSCGNGTLKCQNWAYKAKYGDNDANLDRYVCLPCGSKTGNVSGHTSTSGYTYNGDGKCGMYKDITETVNNCTAYTRTLGPYHPEYPNEVCNKIAAGTVSTTCLGSSCDSWVRNPDCYYHETSIKYTAAAAGYRLSSNSAGNSCVACDVHEYSTAGNTTTSCKPCPYGGATSPVYISNLLNNYGFTEWREGIEHDGGGYMSLATQGTGVGDKCVIAGIQRQDENGNRYVDGSCTIQDPTGIGDYYIKLKWDNTDQSRNWGYAFETVCNMAADAMSLTGSSRSYFLSDCANNNNGAAEQAFSMAFLCPDPELDVDDHTFRCIYSTLYEAQMGLAARGNWNVSIIKEFVGNY